MNILDIKIKFEDKVIKWFEKDSKKIYVDINAKDLSIFAEYMLNNLKMRLITATALDTRHNLEILYHFTDDKKGIIVSLRVFLQDKKNPQIDSLTKLTKAAFWVEREIHELLGIDFVGHPSLTHLLLDQDWPANNYPLRHEDEQQRIK